MMRSKQFFIISILVLSAYFSCAQSASKPSTKFDYSLLQGAWWQGANDKAPLFIITADTLYYTDNQQPEYVLQASGNQVVLKSRTLTKTLTVSKLTPDSLVAHDGTQKLRLFRTSGIHKTISLGDICTVREKGYRDLANYIILTRYKTSMMTDQECALDVISKLARVPVFRNMQALDIFTSKGDDHVKEKMIDVAMDILYDDPEGILLHVSNNRGVLFNSLIDGLSERLTSKKISKDTLKSEITPRLSDDVQRKTLDEIFEKVVAK